MNLVHPVCKIHAESRRMHLLENSFAKADQAGWKPHCTFPLFFPLQNSYRKSNISWKHLCWNRVIPCTSKITSLTQTPMMGTRRQSMRTPPSLHAVSQQQCNKAATTSISLPLICGSGTHTDTGCQRSVYVCGTPCKQLHKTDVMHHVPAGGPKNGKCSPCPQQGWLLVP